MSRHSTLIGGSTAERLLQCPGSWKAIQALPEQPDIPSEAARYGTAMHELMQRVLSVFGPEEELPQLDVLTEIAIEHIGERVYDRVITREHLDESILPALVALQSLTSLYDGTGHDDPFMIAAFEIEVQFPGVVGGYGTADLLLRNSATAILVDWKFGFELVQAVYSEPDGDRLNPQLMFYLTAALNTEPNLFHDRELAVAVIQPRVTEPLTVTDVSREEVVTFTEDVWAAVAKALDRQPPLHRGGWCRWCQAKPVCPEWVGPIKELESLSKDRVPHTQPVTRQPTEYARYLGKAKELTELLKEYAKDVDEQVHAYLADGGEVPGWTLAPKKKLRQWIDEDKVEAHLKQLGFGRDEIWRKQLQTFAVADAIAKRKGVKIPDHLRVAPETDETVVVRDLAAIPVSRPKLMQQLQDSVVLLKQQERK